MTCANSLSRQYFKINAVAKGSNVLRTLIVFDDSYRRKKSYIFWRFNNPSQCDYKEIAGLHDGPETSTLNSSNDQGRIP